MAEAICRANEALEAIESDDTAGVPQDSIASTRKILDELLQSSVDEQYNQAITHVQGLAQKCAGKHSAALYTALRLLRTARSGPLSARIES
jgi:hypothetical protein